MHTWSGALLSKMLCGDICGGGQFAKVFYHVVNSEWTRALRRLWSHLLSPTWGTETSTAPGDQLRGAANLCWYREIRNDRTNISWAGALSTRNCQR